MRVAPECCRFAAVLGATRSTVTRLLWALRCRDGYTVAAALARLVQESTAELAQRRKYGAPAMPDRASGALHTGARWDISSDA
jgi:hypothetical protein